MVNMKDVPSTERMVLCSKQWKMMTQKEKDMFQKRCEQVRCHAERNTRMIIIVMTTQYWFNHVRPFLYFCLIRKRSSTRSISRGSLRWGFTCKQNKTPTTYLTVVFLSVLFFGGGCSLQTLPEEERDRVLTEEKLGGSKLSLVGAGGTFVTKSPSGKVSEP